MAEVKQPKFPSEVIDLPSKGIVYPKDSPLSGGQIEIKYMTAKEEDILTSQNLIKKGVVIDVLINSLIVTKGVSIDDLILGDKNAIMVAARILAYGPEYTVEVTDPTLGDKFQHTFNLTECPFKELSKDVDYSTNEFKCKLPVSKKEVTFKLLVGRDEKQIAKEVASLKKINVGTAEITTRLKKIITAVDGDDSQAVINMFVDNMLARDSLALREKLAQITPDIILTQDIELGGEAVSLDIPMTVEFFWPKTSA
jgi:hypothetical protein